MLNTDFHKTLEKIIKFFTFTKRLLSWMKRKIKYIITFFKKNYLNFKTNLQIKKSKKQHIQIKHIQVIGRENHLPKKITWRIEGPFDSSYSLALLNRETALALKKLGHNVILHSTEGPGDFAPSKKYLKQNPQIKELYKKSLYTTQKDANITSRNLYPPRVRDMTSHLNMLHHYAWEESSFPQAWVYEFNQSLQGMTCLSTHVEKIMLDNGVTVPITTSGCGVDHWEKIIADDTYRLQSKHKFRFLHVSSCFPRKGAEVLLKSYGNTFTSSDNVILIIKTFENPHNKIDQWLAEAKRSNPNYPDVLIIKDDLKETQLKALYQQCDIMVGPSRAEGFGLPFAEAMLSGLSVITTGWGGQLDFCTSDTAWLIEYNFTPAKTHFELFNSVWAEPSEKHLSLLMREIYNLPKELRLQKSLAGRKILLEKFKWEDITKKLVNHANSFAIDNQSIKANIGWITTWNTKCGIAAYSEHLINEMQTDITILAGYTQEKLNNDTNNVYRCWHPGNDDSLIELNTIIDKLELNTIVIQFNYAFFNFEVFNHFLEKQLNKNRTIIIMLHATQDSILTPEKKLNILTDTFKQSDRLLVHSYKDLNRLKSYGLIDNVALFPHGILDLNIHNTTKQNNNFTLASYGFFLPHKGLLELIEAVAILHKYNIKVKLNMINSAYPTNVSQDLIHKAHLKVKSLDLTNYIKLYTDFLPDSESLSLLSKSDLIIFPYQETGESSSASVRYGLTTQVPVVVTPLSIFDDVDFATFKLPGTSVYDIADGIKYLIEEITNNTPQNQQKKKDARRWRDAHRYSNLSTRLSNILTALHNKKIEFITK